MKVTGQRATAGKTTSTKQPARTPKEKRPKGWSAEDRFEAPVQKAASPKKPPKTPRPQAGPELVDAGTRALARDRSSKDEAGLREAGRLLGGLTASVVINLLHQFQSTPVPELDATVQRLGELCGALFVEFLGGMKDDGVQQAPREPDSFSAHFEARYSSSPLEATARFIGFIARTEGAPRERLRGSIYG